MAQKLKQIREKYPNAKIHIVGHSNGGNVAIAAAQAGGPVDTIIRLGSPYFTRLPKDLHRRQWKDLVAVPSGVKVIDFYDPHDTVQFGTADGFGGASYRDPGTIPGWHRCAISVQKITNSHEPLTGREIHSLMRSRQVWSAIWRIIADEMLR